VAKHTKTRTITVKLPVETIALIDMLVKAGLYTTRSEFIRNAVREQLNKELGKVMHGHPEPKESNNSLGAKVGGAHEARPQNKD